MFNVYGVANEQRGLYCMRKDGLRVGHLKQILSGLPDDLPICYQRIEDAYFKKHGWKPEFTLNENNSTDESEYGDYIHAWWAYYDYTYECLRIQAHY